MNADRLIATILRHDKKTASYKLAMIRSLNDLVLGYPHCGEYTESVAVPLRMLAAFWVGYYWPFVDTKQPILQGRQAQGKNDISFRPALTQLRLAWEGLVGASRPGDGFLLASELQSTYRRKSYPAPLLSLFQQAIVSIVDAIQQPIRYAGPGEYAVFARPQRWQQLAAQDPFLIAIPETQPNDLCLVVTSELWQSLTNLSLWAEALCIHEWCLFTEQVAGVDRGYVYSLLTDRPNSRRPLTWERNQIEILMMEGRHFRCPWTGRVLTTAEYDLDRLLPLSVYPLHELWNLVPADRHFIQHTKRDRIPSRSRLQVALPHLAHTYQNYLMSPQLSSVLQSDAEKRFNGRVSGEDFTTLLSQQVSTFLSIVADTRHLLAF